MKWTLHICANGKKNSIYGSQNKWSII